MILDDIGAAFTAAGLKTIVTYSNYIRACALKELKAGKFPIRILQSQESEYKNGDDDRNLNEESNGQIEVIYPKLWIIDKTDRDAVLNKRLWLKEVFKTIENELGFQNEMPVDYQGIRFWLFEPENGRIDDTAELVEQDNLFISAEDLLIAAKLIT